MRLGLDAPETLLSGRRDLRQGGPITIPVPLSLAVERTEALPRARFLQRRVARLIRASARRGLDSVHEEVAATGGMAPEFAPVDGEPKLGGNDQSIAQMHQERICDKMRATKEVGHVYTVTIESVQNGFLVGVGCWRLVFEQQAHLLAEVARYLSQPDQVEQEYQAKYGMKQTPGGIAPLPPISAASSRAR